MVLSRLTKITGPGIRTDTNWVGNNANYTGILTASSLGGIGNLNVTGIITASSFSGDGSGLIGVASTDNIVTGTAATFNTYPVDINAGMTVAGVATFSGNVSIAGTLTYEDVTNIDSVGLVTARTGFVSPYADIDDFVDVGSNIQLGNAGVITATTFKGNGDFVELDVDGHTNLDNVSIAGLSTHSEGIFVPDDKSIRVGGSFSNPDLKIHSSSTYQQGVIDYNRSGTGRALRIRATNLQIENWNGLTPTVKVIGGTGAGHVELNYAGNKKFETTVKGIQVGTGVTVETNGQATFTGIVTASTYYGDGSNLSNITSTTINNNANNRLITGSGTANTLEGESNFTFDGSTATITASSGYSLIANGSSTGIGLGSNGVIVFGNQNIAAYGPGVFDATQYQFKTSGNEKVRIESGGGLKFTGQGTSIPVGGILHHTNNNLYVRGGTNGLILGNQDSTNTIQIYNGYIKFETNDGSEKLRIASDGKVGINKTSPAEMLDVYGTIQCSGAGLKIDTHPIVSYASFTDISGGSYAARLGSTGSSTIRSTQIYGGGNHIATFDGVNYRLGVKTTKPQTALDVRGTISTGRNVARELGTVINVSSNHDGSRVGANVINGNKNYEAGADWLAQGGSRVDANLTIDLGSSISCDRFVIYNQNEYNHSNREVKRFTLEGSNDNSSWTTILDDEAGCSNAHEPNPGWSFRMPAGLRDDDEGVNWRYWRFTMKTFHGSDSYGGIMELELYEQTQTIQGTSEITTNSLVASDISAGTVRTCGQPSFLATASGNNINIGSGGTFPFNTEQYDRTGSYNTSTYQFTAPVTGEYFFFYQVYRNSSTSAEVAIYVNNDAKRRNRCNPNGGDFIFAQSTILRLDSGDVVDLRSYNGNMDNFYGSSSNQRESHFGGYLLG